MFGRKKKLQQQKQQLCEQDIDYAMEDLRKAGYSKAVNERNMLIQYYMTHGLEQLEPELRLTIIMLRWLMYRYGDQSDIELLENANPSIFVKPQNSIYFYWIPSQYIRCRQLGGEIRCRQQNKTHQKTPEPNLQQNVLEEKYVQTRDVVLMMKEIASIPENMEEQFLNFTKKTDAILAIHKQETLIPETRNTVKLASRTQYNQMNVKSMKPRFEDGSYTFTNYLNGDMPVEDYGKIGTPRAGRGRQSGR